MTTKFGSRWVVSPIISLTSKREWSSTSSKQDASGKSRCMLKFPTKNVIILVVTGILGDFSCPKLCCQAGEAADVDPGRLSHVEAEEIGREVLFWGIRYPLLKGLIEKYRILEDLQVLGLCCVFFDNFQDFLSKSERFDLEHPRCL